MALVDTSPAQLPGPDEVPCAVQLGDEDIIGARAGHIERTWAWVEICVALEDTGSENVP